MDAEFQQVIESYHRARAQGDLFESFYEIFLAKSPEVQAKFAATDFTRQRRMLKESLLTVLAVRQGIQESCDEVARLAERHSSRDLDIAAPLYDLWLDALCEAVARHDAKFTPELETAWRKVLAPGIAMMRDAY